MSALMHAIIYLLSPVQMGSLVEWCCGETCCFEGMTQENRGGSWCLGYRHGNMVQLRVGCRLLKTERAEYYLLKICSNSSLHRIIF